MQQDMAMVWLSNADRSVVTGLAPSYCYAALGKRYRVGEWPSAAPTFFSGPCR
jgi:hypothetical protein